MSTNLSRLLSRSLETTARKRVTKQKTFKQARSELIRAIAKADGSSTSVTYMVLRGGAQCPEMMCLRAFAKVLPVGMKTIMSAVARDGCEYNANGRGRKRKGRAAQKQASQGGRLVCVKAGRIGLV